MADANEIARENELINQINALRAENAALEAELQTAERNVNILTGNVGRLEANVHAKMTTLDDKVEVTAEDTTLFYTALTDLTEQYFIFKNLSTASKNLTQYTDYQKLRRISLGYVIGLDSAIISDENLRKEVEKAYLQNTDYWLAYAIMAVTLWAENEREAASRALNKALSMDYNKSCLFFLLINLRFERVAIAREWYLNYLDKLDITRLGDEFQYLLQAYLNGLFGNDPEFEAMVADNFQRLVQQAEATSARFGDKFTDGAQAYAQAHLHRTQMVFPTLKEVSRDHDALTDLLSQAEKHAVLARNYVELAEEEETLPEDQAQRVENILYNLINSYDTAEWRVVKEQKRNEAIIEAKGNLAAAHEKFELLYGHVDEKKALADLMVSWAFSEDPTQTNLTVKRFSISMMKSRIVRGFEKFAEAYRQKEPERISVRIDECELSVREDEAELQAAQLDAYFNKNKLKHYLADKQIKIYGVMCIAALLILIIMAFSFSPAALTIAVLLGVVGGFLLWRRIVDVGKILAEKRRLAHVKLGQAIGELAQWRAAYQTADAQLPDLQQALDRF